MCPAGWTRAARREFPQGKWGGGSGRWMRPEMKKAARSGCFLNSGAGNRSRTYDLRITNALLYQLSYAGKTICLMPWNDSRGGQKNLLALLFFPGSGFLGPDLERPKSYQSFFAMGNKRRVFWQKNRRLHTSKFSFIISFLSSSPIAQSVERRTVNPQVAGSSPARGAKEFWGHSRK